MQGHADDLIAPAPPGPWNPQTNYSGNEDGDWIKYYRDILNQCLQAGAPPTALALHKYTHGTDPSTLSSEEKMGAPFQNYHKHFRAYQDFLSVVSQSLQSLPVFITETQPADPDWWEKHRMGWVQAAYTEINAWNSISTHQPIQALCLFRWETGDSRWSISDKPSVRDDFRAALQNDYCVRMLAAHEEPPPRPVPVTPKPMPATGATRAYTVQSGDTLSKIARQFGISVEVIVTANNIANLNLIRPGQVLVIPES